MAKEDRADIETEDEIIEGEVLEEEGETTSVIGGKGNGQRKLTSEEIVSLQEFELAKKIPGYGSLFRVPKKYIHEACRLPNDMAAFAFAARDMQQATLDLSGARIDSAWDVFKYAYMGYTIGIEGKGRDDQIALQHLTIEEKEAAARGGLLDENP